MASQVGCWKSSLTLSFIIGYQKYYFLHSWYISVMFKSYQTITLKTLTPAIRVIFLKAVATWFKTTIFPYFHKHSRREYMSCMLINMCNVLKSTNAYALLYTIQQKSFNFDQGIILVTTVDLETLTCSKCC